MAAVDPFALNPLAIFRALFGTRWRSLTAKALDIDGRHVFRMAKEGYPVRRQRWVALSRYIEYRHKPWLDRQLASRKAALERDHAARVKAADDTLILLKRNLERTK